MPPVNPRIVLVDTNCYLRLYQSPVLPLLGQDAGGYRLLTLESLVTEFINNPKLVANYSWVASGAKAVDLSDAVLKLSGINKNRVEKERRVLKPYAKTYLLSYSRKQGISPPKELSANDLELLATAVTLHTHIATDEWPLRLVVEDLMDDSESYDVGLFHSLDILHLLEAEGKLDANDRRKTVDSWIRNNEKLPRSWRRDYKRLFKESADSLGQP